MLGLIAAGVAGYVVHKARKSNSYTVAKALESAIDEGRDIRIKGNFDQNEVVKIMAEDGYNLFDYITF